MLTALKKLSMGCSGHPEDPYRDLSGEEVVLRLPNLADFCVCYLKDGTLVMSCPKLKQARFVEACSFQVTMVEESDMRALMLEDCKDIRFAGVLPESQLQKLESLTVTGCTDLGRHIIQNVSRMHNLKRLGCKNFPAACMPQSFPQSLQRMFLSLLETDCDLPKGLKELTNLTELWFGSSRMTWDFHVPLAELLPMDSLEALNLGSSRYVRKDNAGKGTFKQVW